MIFRYLMFLFALLSCANTYAAQCSATFPDGVQTTSTSAGTITFNNNAQLRNSPDNVIDTHTIAGGGASSSCFTAACQEINGASTALNPGSFLTSSSTTDLTVAANGSATLTQANYRNVVVNSGATLNGSSSFSAVRMSSVSVGTNAILRLTAGEYWVSTLSMANGSRLEVAGAGTVRFFVQNSPTLGNSIIFNVVPPASNSQFFIYGYSSLNFGTNTQFNGLAYSASSVFLDNNTIVNGAITAASGITLDNNSVVFFDASAASNVDLGTLCSAGSNGPVGYWQMEQNSWSGVANEVSDSSANALHGTSFAGAQTRITSPALTGNPGTCRYAEFLTASNQYVNIAHNTKHSFDSSFTATAWIYLSSYNSGGLRSFLSKDENYEMHVYQDGRLNWWMQGTAGTGDFYSTQTIPLNQWRHVAFRFQKGQQDFFIGGSRDSAARRNYNGTLTQNTDPLQIGQDQNFAGRYWNGFIDEVKLYNRALTDAEITAIASERHVCASSIDHYRVELSSDTALTCKPATVTIKACADSSCSSLYSGSSTVTMAANNGAVWSSIAAFTGSTSATLSKTSVGSTTISLTSANPSASNNVQCYVAGINRPCSLTYVSSGLVWAFPPTNISTGINTITANKTVSAITLQAVRQDDTTQHCAPAFSGTRTIQFSRNYVSPATGTLAVQLNGSTITNNTSLSLNFDSNAQASLSLSYADAGQLQLSALYSGSVANGDNGLTLQGTSTVVSTPAGFCVEAMNGASPQASCASNACPLYQRAGEDFSMRVRAMAWQADGETGTQLCSGNAVTPNFNGTVNMTSTMADGGNNGVLGLSSLAISNGDSTFAHQTISEVGRFSFTTTGSYFGLTLPNDTSAVYGRFAAYDFDVQITTLTAACTTFTYAGLSNKTGQSFALAGTVTARNKQNNITTNYQGAYAKLNGGSVSFADFIAGNPSALGDVVAPHTLSFTSGVANFSPLTATYVLGAPQAPQNVQLRAIATEGAGNDGTTGQSTLSSALEFRLGRLRLENAYGPEILPLTIPLRAEYFDGSRYIVNTLDNCSDYVSTNATLTLFNGNLSSTETGVTTPATQTNLLNGLYNTTTPLQLTAPGLGNDGSAQLTLTVPTWLQFDWLNNNSAQDPSSTVTFGRYRGSDRVIYWKEKR